MAKSQSHVKIGYLGEGHAGSVKVDSLREANVIRLELLFSPQFFLSSVSQGMAAKRIDSVFSHQSLSSSCCAVQWAVLVWI